LWWVCIRQYSGVVKKLGPSLTAGCLLDWEQKWEAISVGVETAQSLLVLELGGIDGSWIGDGEVNGSLLIPPAIAQSSTRRQAR